MIPEVVTFGCRLNTYESSVIEKLSLEAGIENAIIFNSCAVTSEAERQLRQAIRSKRKQFPDATIIVTGCAAQVNHEKYSSMSEVDFIIGNAEKMDPEAYRRLSEQKVAVSDIMLAKEAVPHMVEGFEGRARGFLQVQNGCNHRCTFCIIPYARGNSRSVPLGEIVKQAQLLCEHGYHEIVLTGVDVTDYGGDLPGSPSFGGTIKRLLKQVPALKRLRLSSIDVAEVDEDLLDLIANEPRFMPYLHLSLQSGDDLILKRMKRRHNRQQVFDFCAKVRKLRPEITFGADIIAGFPTETDEMFNNSLNVIEEVGLQFLHIFPYSEREGTPAARMPQVAKQLRKKRAAMLREAGNKQLALHYNQKVGTVMSAICESENRARAEDFSLIKLDSPATGEVKVKITDADGCNHLIGEVV
jgi:threonylcarbamoyladenosine tRNA methylthiotransferase MtaB